MNNITPASLTALIKESLHNEGFGPVGIAPAVPHHEDSKRIADWVAAGMHGSLVYMERNNDKRADVTALVPGARSVIVAALNYFNEDIPKDEDRYRIARYARGGDYHVIIREKLLKSLSLITTAMPEASGRVFTDTAPLSEKAWAIRAGLGWRGRHSIIINKESGSFFLLGEIVTTARLEYDEPYTEDHCGSCTLCVDSCPTGAINSNHTINATKCIAYHTIENPPAETNYTGKMIFGCDRCQEVCPWNTKAAHTNIKEFFAPEEIVNLRCHDWENMSKERFDRLFSFTPLTRTGYEGMMRNVRIAKKNSSI
jgi:epoxyqueuosine reductase